MRDRAWRRYVEEKKIIKRIHNIGKVWYWYGHEDINGFCRTHSTFKDYIGSNEHKMFKTHTTKSYDSRNKDKYSPNKTKTYRVSSGDKQTREYQRRYFLRILKEYGLK